MNTIKVKYLTDEINMNTKISIDMILRCLLLDEIFKPVLRDDDEFIVDEEGYIFHNRLVKKKIDKRAICNIKPIFGKSHIPFDKLNSFIYSSFEYAYAAELY